LSGWCLLKHSARNSRTTPTKPITFTAWDPACLRDIYEVGTAVAGDEERLRRKPSPVHYAMAIAPLVHPKESIEKMLYCAEQRIAKVYNHICPGHLFRSDHFLSHVWARSSASSSCLS
jgi:trimethylamine:corrinoid methyltransferase-like protein